MKEVLSFHMGQAGIQLGHAVWELITAEHNVCMDGVRNLPKPGSPKYFGGTDRVESFFAVTGKDHYTPRCIMVDLEPSVADEIRHGSYRDLFHPNSLITGMECTGNNFARGLFCADLNVMNSLKLQIRKECERCDGIQAFVIFRSLGGGTGTGTTVALCDFLLDYAKISRMEVPIYPSPSLATSTVEPYNAVLGEHYCMEDMDIGLLFDNEAMYDMCHKFLGIANPHYCHLNRLVAQVISCVTSSIRFDNTLNNDIPTMQTNLVPYPRIHFPMCNFSPVVNGERLSHQPLKVQKLVRSVFEQANQMVKCDTRNGRFMACSLFLRGKIHASHVYQTLTKVKAQKNVRFVDWDPTGFKVGVVNRPPTIIPASMLGNTPNNCTMVANHTSIGQAWSRLMHKFQMLYSRRSFIHWYVSEGLEEGEFSEALENMQALINDYKDVSVLSTESDKSQASEEEDEEAEEIREDGNNKSNQRNLPSDNDETSQMTDTYGR